MFSVRVDFLTPVEVGLVYGSKLPKIRIQAGIQENFCCYLSEQFLVLSGERPLRTHRLSTVSGRGLRREYAVQVLGNDCVRGFPMKIPTLQALHRSAGGSNTAG